MRNINIKYKFSAAVIVCFAIVALIIRIIVFPELSVGFQIRAFFASLCVLTFLTSVYFAINNSLNKLFPYEKGVTGRIILQLIIGLVFLFGTQALVLNFGLNHLPFKLDKMFIIAILIVGFFACFAINFAFFAEYFFSQWKISIQKAERLEREKTRVQYDNLKNQLNPHFLFNALASLNSLIRENQDQASQFLKQLSKVYRYLLENKEVVSLTKELEFLENYLSLLKTRFGKALIIEIKIKETDKAFHIVPVTLQSLLENALKHNILTEEIPLHITIYSDNSYLCVKNSLQLKSIVENSNKQGLMNLRNLYRYLSPKAVMITETEDKFSVKVPLI